MYFEKFCKTCPTNTHCCVFNHDAGFTFVSVEDAYAIAKNTGRRFDTFLDYSPLSAKSLSALKRDDPMYEGALRLSQLDSDNRILRLKKQENGKCIFLTNSGKCGIYSSRPKICQIYPFWGMRLISGDIKVLSHDTAPRCPIVVSMIKSKEDIEECLSVRQLQSIRQSFEEIEKEDISYRQDIKSFQKML